MLRIIEQIPNPLTTNPNRIKVTLLYQSSSSMVRKKEKRRRQGMKNGKRYLLAAIVVLLATIVFSGLAMAETASKPITKINVKDLEIELKGSPIAYQRIDFTVEPADATEEVVWHSEDATSTSKKRKVSLLWQRLSPWSIKLSATLTVSKRKCALISKKRILR